MARKSKSRQEGRGRSRRRSALLFLARWSLVLLIWTGFLAGGIVLWYARDLPDTSRLNEITRRPAVTLVTRYENAMPQYHVGHIERVQRIEAATAKLTRLELIGSAYRGVGIPDVIADAERAAERAFSTLR